MNDKKLAEILGRLDRPAKVMIGELCQRIALRGDRIFIQGMALALAEAHRYGASDESVTMAAKAAGLTLREIEKAGVEVFDCKELRAAGVQRSGAKKRKP